MLAQLPAQYPQRRFIQGHMDVPTAFGLVRMNPTCFRAKIHLRPFQLYNIRLPQPRSRRKDHGLTLMLWQFCKKPV